MLGHLNFYPKIPKGAAVQIQYNVTGTHYVRTPQTRQDSNEVDSKGFGAKDKQYTQSLIDKRDLNPQNTNETQGDLQNNSTQESNKSQKIYTQETQRLEEEKNKKEKIQELEGHKNRITYGLKVLELMSDDEYRAFLWASEGMSDSEKMLMAQSLYRFTSFYQGKHDEHKEPLDNQTLDAQKAFGVESSITRDFINRYKNAYERVIQTKES